MYEDEDYDDDDYDDEDDSSRGLLIALVIVLIFGVLVVFVAISVLVGAQTGALDRFFARQTEPTPTASQAAASSGEEVESLDSATAGADPAASFGLDEQESDLSVQAPGSASDSVESPAAQPKDLDFEEPSTPAPTRMASPRPSTAKPAASRSRSRGSDTSANSSRSRASRGSSSGGNGGRSSGGSSSGGSSSLGGSRPSSSTGSTRTESASSRSSRSNSSSRASTSAQDDVARVLDDDDVTAGAASRARAEARSGGPTMSYDKNAVAGLSGKAAGGALTDTQRRALQNVPADSPQFTLAWATVMKNAEVKKDYKGHCAAAAKVMQKPRNKYHPEWNLELAKCQLRNGSYVAAVRSVDRTLGDSFGMSAATKVDRLLLAYQIKAQSRTRLYDNHAKENAGVSDKNKLNSAIQAWMEYRNYATGIGRDKAVVKSNREISDLEQRKGQ